MTNITVGQTPIVIDRRSHEPFEEQLYSQIKNLILRHQTDSNLTDPSLLAKELDISKEVVIHAFGRLVDERYYEIDEKGKYQISYKELVWVSTDSLSSVADIIHAHGQELYIDPLKVETIICDQAIQELTGFPIGAKLFYQDRVYYGDNIPKAIYRVYYLASIFPDANSEQNIHRPYYHITNYDIKVSPVERYVMSVRLPDDINNLLNQKSGTAGFCVVEKIFTANGVQSTFAEGYLNSNYIFQYKTKVE